MTEITRVPLRPIASGSLTKLWLGVLAAVLAGVGLAWASIPASTRVTTLQAGSGPMPQDGDVVFINYVGKLTDGTEFDKSTPPPIPEGIFPKGNPFPLEEGATIPGFGEALRKVQKGGRYTFEIPAAKAYGASPPPGSSIPANADLVFDVEVTGFMSREDFQMRMQALQQMMQQQQGAEGGPGGPAGPGGPPPQPR